MSFDKEQADFIRNINKMGSMHHGDFLSQSVSPNNTMRRTQTNSNSKPFGRGLSGSLVKVGATSPEIHMRSSADAANFLDKESSSKNSKPCSKIRG